MELMTKSEIHDFGVEVVFGYLQKNDFKVESVNTDLDTDPQIVCLKDSRLYFIVVRTDCYPAKGKLNTQERAKIVDHAEKHKAVVMFASVGIANSSSSDPQEMGIPVKGAGFYVAFEGLIELS